MATFMTIPRELRDQVCFYVMHSRKEPPALDQTFTELTASRVKVHPRCMKSASKTVLSLEEEYVSNSCTLLRVNRQLRAETLENMKLEAKGCTYELDIIILDEIAPLTTWTYVPILTQKLDKVTATFRISGSYDAQKERSYRPRDKDGYHEPLPNELYAAFDKYKGFRCGDGAGPAMSWQIYSILERFLKIGPPIRKSLQWKAIGLLTLEINVQTPPNVDPKRFGIPRSGGYRHEDMDRDDSVLDPSYLLRFIQSNLETLLRSNDRDWFSYGKILFEHVDQIIIKMDGEELETLNVALNLRDAGGFKGYPSREQLKTYKESTWRLRKERGLEVLED